MTVNKVTKCIRGARGVNPVQQGSAQNTPQGLEEGWKVCDLSKYLSEMGDFGSSTLPIGTKYYINMGDFNA